MARIKPPLKLEIDSYLQKLLILQYQASDSFCHKPTKGTLREKFIKQLITNEFPHISLQSGILLHGGWQSSQMDCILLNPNARHGNMDCYNVIETKLCMEIKSCVKTSELAALEKVAKVLKQIKSDIKVGMFAYTTAVTQKTILKNFGFLFDKYLLGYSDYQPTKDEYPNIDFMFVLEVTDMDDLHSYYLTKDNAGHRSCFLQNPLLSTLLANFQTT